MNFINPIKSVQRSFQFIFPVLFFFVIYVAGPMPMARGDELVLPNPGEMVRLSPEFTPAYLKGIIIHPENAFKFDFIVYRGDRDFTGEQKKEEYTKLIKYFLASLAVPDEDQWVNLSPYESDRIIKDDFGKTRMGWDLLAQDYMLKQITASLIYPQDKLGQEFWSKVYSAAYRKFGTTNIQIDTFNKVWIMPDKADIYQKGNVAYVYKSHLKVMLEEDYLALKKHNGISALSGPQAGNKTHAIASQVVREIVLPQLEKEVNEGKHFSVLRQIFSGMILAAWYKKELKETLLSKIYADQVKLKGIDQDPRNNERIYQQYLKAFKKGVFNFIKEDEDKYTHEAIPRKYFSGGFDPEVDKAMKINAPGSDLDSKADISIYGDKFDIAESSVSPENPVILPAAAIKRKPDSAMSSRIVSKILSEYIKEASDPNFQQMKASLEGLVTDHLSGQITLVDMVESIGREYKGGKLITRRFAEAVLISLLDAFDLNELQSGSVWNMNDDFIRQRLSYQKENDIAFAQETLQDYFREAGLQRDKKEIRLLAVDLLVLNYFQNETLYTALVRNEVSAPPQSANVITISGNTYSFQIRRGPESYVLQSFEMGRSRVGFQKGPMAPMMTDMKISSGNVFEMGIVPSSQTPAINLGGEIFVFDQVRGAFVKEPTRGFVTMLSVKFDTTSQQGVVVTNMQTENINIIDRNGPFELAAYAERFVPISDRAMTKHEPIVEGDFRDTMVVWQTLRLTSDPREIIESLEKSVFDAYFKGRAVRFSDADLNGHINDVLLENHIFSVNVLKQALLKNIKGFLTTLKADPLFSRFNYALSLETKKPYISAGLIRLKEKLPLHKMRLGNDNDIRADDNIAAEVNEIMRTEMPLMATHSQREFYMRLLWADVEMYYNGIEEDHHYQANEKGGEGDGAMQAKGGIDFNAANFDLHIKRSGNSMLFSLNRQYLGNIRIDGLVPVILEIKPALGSQVISELSS